MQTQIQKSWLVESDSVNRETQIIVSSHKMANVKINIFPKPKKYGDTLRSSVVRKADKQEGRYGFPPLVRVRLHTTRVDVSAE